MQRPVTFVFVVCIAAAVSCKTVGRIAAKYCKLNRVRSRSSFPIARIRPNWLYGQGERTQILRHAVDVVAEQYHNYQDAKDIPDRTV